MGQSALWAVLSHPIDTVRTGWQAGLGGVGGAVGGVWRGVVPRAGHCAMTVGVLYGGHGFAGENSLPAWLTPLLHFAIYPLLTYKTHLQLGHVPKITLKNAWGGFLPYFVGISVGWKIVTVGKEGDRRVGEELERVRKEVMEREMGGGHWVF